MVAQSHSHLTTTAASAQAACAAHTAGRVPTAELGCGCGPSTGPSKPRSPPTIGVSVRGGESQSMVVVTSGVVGKAFRRRMCENPTNYTYYIRRR